MAARKANVMYFYALMLFSMFFLYQDALAADTNINSSDVPLKLIFSEAVDCNSARPGLPVRFRVVQEILDVHGRVAIASGTPAWGTVTFSRPQRMAGIRGILKISCESTFDRNGGRIPLKGELINIGRGSNGATIASGMLFSWPLLLTLGGKASYPAGSEFTAFIPAETYARIMTPDPLFMNDTLDGETEEESLKWTFQEAHMGNPTEQFHLGTRYYYGFKVKQDSIKAIAWFSIAAENSRPSPFKKQAENYFKTIGLSLNERAIAAAVQFKQILSEKLRN